MAPQLRFSLDDQKLLIICMDGRVEKRSFTLEQVKAATDQTLQSWTLTEGEHRLVCMAARHRQLNNDEDEADDDA